MSDARGKVPRARPAAMESKIRAGKGFWRRLSWAEIGGAFISCAASLVGIVAPEASWARAGLGR